MSAQRRKPWFWLMGLAVSIILLLGSIAVLFFFTLGSAASGPGHSAPASNTPIVIAVVSAVVSGLATLITAAGTIATTAMAVLMALRKDHREREMHELEVAKRRAELEKEK